MDMYQRTPEELSVSLQLSKRLIDEITIRAFAEAGLSEMEQIIFSLRHRLNEDNPADYLMTLEDIVEEIRRDSGEKVSTERAMSFLERAEAKVNQFAWDTLEKATRGYFGMDYAE